MALLFFWHYPAIVCDIAAVLAQTVSEPPPISQTMEVTRIGVADLMEFCGRPMQMRVRELLDAQRQKFQDEFSLVEAELQQTERDLMSKRELLSAEEYDKQIKAFQVRVTQLPARHSEKKTSH